MEDGNKQTTTEDPAKEVGAPVETSDKPVADNSGTNMVDRAIEAAERGEKVAERLEKANKETASLDARRALGGSAGGGIQHKPKTQDELDEEAAKLFMQDDE